MASLRLVFVCACGLYGLAAAVGGRQATSRRHPVTVEVWWYHGDTKHRESQSVSLAIAAKASVVEVEQKVLEVLKKKVGYPDIKPADWLRLHRPKSCTIDNQSFAGRTWRQLPFEDCFKNVKHTESDPPGVATYGPVQLERWTYTIFGLASDVQGPSKVDIGLDLQPRTWRILQQHILESRDRLQAEGKWWLTCVEMVWSVDGQGRVFEHREAVEALSPLVFQVFEEQDTRTLNECSTFDLRRGAGLRLPVTVRLGTQTRVSGLAAPVRELLGESKIIDVDASERLSDFATSYFGGELRFDPEGAEQACLSRDASATFKGCHVKSLKATAPVAVRVVLETQDVRLNEEGKLTDPVVVPKRIRVAEFKADFLKSRGYNDFERDREKCQDTDILVDCFPGQEEIIVRPTKFQIWLRYADRKLEVPVAVPVSITVAEFKADYLKLLGSDDFERDQVKCKDTDPVVDCFPNTERIVVKPRRSFQIWLRPKAPDVPMTVPMDITVGKFKTDLLGPLGLGDFEGGDDCKDEVALVDCLREDPGQQKVIVKLT